MKRKTLLFSILIGFKAFSQELPTNPHTGLVSIKDSFDVKNKSLQEIKEIMNNWSRTLMDMENLKSIYKLNNSKQTETMATNLPVGSVLTQDKGNNKFVTNGQLSYSKIKATGLNAFTPTATSGSVKFAFIYTITPQKVIYEFTNMGYVNRTGNEGKFEDEKPPKQNGTFSVLSPMSKKEWSEVRAEYFERIKTLATNLSEYVSNLSINNQASLNQTPINYESYKQIKTGMAYDEVVKLLADEGKELSNTTTQANGKTVTQQTIVWTGLDKTKSITITFENSKVVSKSQNNL